MLCFCKACFMCKNIFLGYKEIMDRLSAIVSLVKNAKTLADIGTDHGYVCEMAIKEDRTDRVIASDINEMPLESAIKNLTECGFANICEFRLGSGLEVLNIGEADVAVIAGMGGELISDIMDKNKVLTRSINELILQPMQNIDKLRLYLHDNNYRIEKEIIVKEGHRYYFIMLVTDGKQVFEDDIFLEVSEYLFLKRDSLFKEYLQKRIVELDKVIVNLSKSNTNESQTRKIFFESKLNKYKELVLKYEA